MDMTCKKCVASEQHKSHEQAESQELLIPSPGGFSGLCWLTAEQSWCQPMFVLWRCSCRCSSQKTCGSLQVLPGGECWCGSKKKMSRWDKPLSLFWWEMCKYAFMDITTQMFKNQLQNWHQLPAVRRLTGRKFHPVTFSTEILIQKSL